MRGWIVAGALAGAGLVAACARPEVEVGRAAYAENCAVCHGAGGRGDGPVAARLARPPADLTRLAARNGGTFDAAAVMSAIDGYFRRGDSAHPMPEFGEALAAEDMVLVDLGDGVLTPAPETLAALAAYLRSIQR
jgi:mono/diheme cytochrome c family protein